MLDSVIGYFLMIINIIIILTTHLKKTKKNNTIYLRFRIKINNIFKKNKLKLIETMPN